MGQWVREDEWINEASKTAFVQGYQEMSGVELDQSMIERIKSNSLFVKR
jgi:hypothetical protein